MSLRWRFIGCCSVALLAMGGVAAMTPATANNFDSLLARASALQSGQQRHADQAVPLLREAIALAVAEHDPMRETKAQVKLGAACISTHDHECARAALERGLLLAHEGGDFETETSALISLGSMYGELGQADEAVRIYERLLETATSRHDVPARVRALNGLAALADRTGRGADGIRYARMALKELDDGARHGVTFAPQAFFSIPYNLGKGLSEEGEYLEASRYFERARTAAENMKLIAGIWHVLHETGEMDRMQGDLAGAERYYDRALDVARKIESRDPEAMTVRALGQIAEERGDLAAALARYEAALAMFQTAGFAVEVVDTIVSMSRVQFLLGRRSDAKTSLDRAASLLPNLNEPATMTRLKLESANQELRAGSSAQAAADYAAAFHIADTAGIRTLVPQALLGMAEAAVMRGDIDRALELFARGADTIDAVRANIPSPDQRASFVDATHRTYEEWFDTLLDSAKGPHIDRREQAFLVLERERSRNLFDALHAAAVVRSREQSAAAVRARRYAAQVSSLQIQLGGAGMSTQQRQSLLERLDDAEHVLDVTASAAAAQNRSMPRNAGMLSRHLSSGEALVEFAQRGDRLVVFLVTRDGFQVLQQRIPDLDARIDLFNALLLSPRSEEAVQVGLRLSRKLLGDALPVLGDRVHRILFCVAGDLAGLPFAALPDPQDAGARPLVSRYEIGYVPSLLALAEMRTRAERAAPFDVLALAPLADGGRSAAVPSSRAELGPLPWSRSEVDRIGALMSGRVRTLTGASATETAFKQSALSDYKVIHLATHALLDPDVPSRSAIVFARSTGGDDGWLQPREIASLDLSGQLVVLSACESAAGRPSHAEGVHSLARAFTYGGAKTVVGTLWRVEDSSSAAFVVEMYRAIAGGESVGGALRTAQLRVAGDHPYRNAQQWAGWIASGDAGFRPPLAAPSSVRWYAIASALMLLAAGALLISRRPP